MTADPYRNATVWDAPLPGEVLVEGNRITGWRAARRAAEQGGDASPRAVRWTRR